MKRLLALLIGIPLVALACTSLFHSESPVAQAVTCEVTGDVLATVEAAAAALCGPLDSVCLAAIETVFGDACTAAANTGADQATATKAGVDAVKVFSMKAATLRAKMSAPDAGAP